jgi:hypothetical protein
MKMMHQECLAELSWQTRERSGPAQPPKAGVCLKPHNSVCDVIALLKPVQHGTEQNRDFIRGSRQWLSNRDQQRGDPPPPRYVSKAPSSTMLTAISPVRATRDTTKSVVYRSLPPRS